MSISQIWRALQNQKADVEIMRCIARMRSPNVSNLAEALGTDRKSVRYHLYKLKSEGCVRDRWVGMTSPVGNKVLYHEWQLTEEGWRLLRGGGLIVRIPAFDNLSFARKSALYSRVDRAVTRGQSNTAQTRPARTHDQVDLPVE